MGHLDNQSAGFYLDNCAELKLKKTKCLSKLIENLSEFQSMDLKKHKDFFTSYDDTYDLKKDANLNEDLIKFLFDQNIPSKIRALTGRDCVLGDLVLRKSRNVKSYMPWHRDTYLDKNRKLVGRTPPLIKLIFYPQLESSCSHELTVLKGSSRRIFQNYYIDTLQRYFVKHTKIFQSNDKCILFDSSIIHSAIASSKNSNGSFRLIFNFCDRNQVDDFKSGQNIKEMYEKYEFPS